MAPTPPPETLSVSPLLRPVLFLKADRFQALSLRPHVSFEFNKVCCKPRRSSKSSMPPSDWFPVEPLSRCCSGEGGLISCWPSSDRFLRSRVCHQFSSLLQHGAYLRCAFAVIIRYPHYALSSIQSCPSWLTYLRYTAFIILYPIGIAPGEMYLIYQALPFIKERNLYASFFQKLPISYHSFVVALLICYPVLWLKLYLHLFKQRRYKLGRKEPKKRI